jgi:hypothetical protein
MLSQEVLTEFLQVRPVPVCTGCPPAAFDRACEQWTEALAEQLEARNVTNDEWGVVRRPDGTHYADGFYVGRFDPNEPNRDHRVARYRVLAWTQGRHLEARTVELASLLEVPVSLESVSFRRVAPIDHAAGQRTVDDMMAGRMGDVAPPATMGRNRSMRDLHERQRALEQRIGAVGEGNDRIERLLQEVIARLEQRDRVFGHTAAQTLAAVAEAAVRPWWWHVVRRWRWQAMQDEMSQRAQRLQVADDHSAKPTTDA